MLPPEAKLVEDLLRMTIDEILETLTAWTDEIPSRAIRAAIAQKEAIAPRLIEGFEAIAADPNELAKATKSFYPMAYIYLLAGFREKKALPAVLKVLSLPGDTPKRLFHYVLEDGLISILSSMFDGNTDALVEVILRPDVNPDVVIGVANTITMAFFDGAISREEMLRAFGRLFKELSPDAPATVWRPVICSAAEAQASELFSEIKAAFERLHDREPIPEDELSVKILKDWLGASLNQVREEFSVNYPKIDDPYAEIEMQWELGPLFDELAEAADEIEDGEEEEFEDSLDEPAPELPDIVPFANPPEATPEITSILRDLSWRGKAFPETAVRYAINQKEAITPHLIYALENVIANAEAFFKTPRYVLHLYALFLMAQFRDPRAFPLAVRLATLPGALVDKFTSGVYLEDWSRILVSVCGDRLEPLADLAMNREASPYIRAAAVQAMPLLVMEKIVPRQSLLEAYTRMFDKLTDDEGPEVWGSLLVSVAYAQLHELINRVSLAHKKGLGVDWVPPLGQLKELFFANPKKNVDKFQSSIYWMTDVVERIEYSERFSSLGYEDRFVEPELDEPIDLTSPPDNSWEPPPPPQPVKREAPKVGRNDPCPCGSGKKYKKCCLGKNE